MMYNGFFCFFWKGIIEIGGVVNMWKIVNENGWLNWFK